MPALDMPLENLKTYMGTTPCPADLDEYWDRALAEMYAIDPQPIFTPYDFGSTCCDAFGEPFIRGIDGHPDGLYTRNLFLDTAMLARVVMELPYVDAQRVGVFGNSQGGGLALACASLMPNIKLCATQNPYMCDYQRVWEMDLCTNAYNSLRYYIRVFDPRCQRIQEIFTKMGYIDVQHLVKRIRGKVLMATGLMDNTCPPSSQFAAYNKIVSEKEMMLYPGFGHEEFFGHKTIVYKFLCQL